MKRLILFLLLLVGFITSKAQVTGTYQIKGADTVKIWKDGGVTEFILLNKTKDTTGGFLFNKGNGLTEFKRVMKKVNDTTYVFGNDTMRLALNLGNFIQNQNGFAQVGAFKIDGTGWAGRLNIGSPSTNYGILNIKQGVSDLSGISLQTGNSAIAPNIFFGRTTVEGKLSVVSANGQITSVSKVGDFILNSNINNRLGLGVGNKLDRYSLLIDTTGKVGVNITSGNPNYDLDVNGTFRITKANVPFVSSLDTVAAFDAITGQMVKTKVTGGAFNAKYSITKISGDTALFTNDTALNVATGKKFNYQLDSTGRRAYYEDKYVMAKTFAEIRKLRIPDTSYIFRVNIGGTIGDYRYDPSDVSTADDTVITIVSTAGYRYKRYISDGIYDPHWWGAKANGTYDDTWAVQQAINAANKYTGNNGTIIRLTGNYKFDPTNFVYNTGRGLVFEVTGNVQLLNTWKIVRGVSIIGKGGATAEASFAWSNIASIQYTVTNSGAPKPAIQCTYGASTLKNLTIGSYGGIGVKLDGITFLPAALALFQNVSVSVGAYTAGKQTALYIADWFWFKFDNCSFSVDGTSINGSAAIKIEGKTFYPDVNLSYLGEFDNCTTQGKPIRINAGDSADASLNVGIGNISFHNLTIENIQNDTAAVILNSSKIAIDNIIFERTLWVDSYNDRAFMYNYGKNTNGIVIKDYDVLGVGAKRFIDGDAINGKTLFSHNSQAINYNYNGVRTLSDNILANGYYDMTDVNRGWLTPLQMQLYNGGQIAKNAAQLKDSITTSGCSVSKPFIAYNGDTLAVKITPSGTSQPNILFKQFERVWRTGDKIYMGAWVKSDLMDSIYSTALKIDIDNYLFQETASGSISSQSNYITRQNNGWRLLTLVATIDAAQSLHSLHKAYLYVSSNDTTQSHVYYVSHPFAYVIDSATYNNDELQSWVKTNAGGLYGVPAKSYGIRGDEPLYIGDRIRAQDTLVQVKDYLGVWNNLGSGGSSFSLAAIGSTPNANGATYSGGTFNLQPADGSFGGIVSTSAQTFAGAKTFTSQLTVSGNTPNNPTGLFGGMNVQSFSAPNGFVANNLYYNNAGGGYKYIANGEGAQFHFVNGDIIFETAPSGSAGATATATERMRVINTGNVTIPGNLAVGSSTSPSWPLDVSGVIRSKGGTASFLLNNRATDAQSILLYSPTASTFSIYDFVNNVSRFDIDNTGQVGIATIPSAKFHVNGSVRFDLGSDATLDMYYRASGGNVARLPIGTALQQLRVNSGATAYEWFTPATSVTSLNSATGAVSIVAGSGITTSTVSGTITVAVDLTNSVLPHTIQSFLTDANNTSTTETDLYSSTIAANKLGSNGGSLHFDFSGQLNDATATADVQLYFAGTSFGNTGALTLSTTGAWSAKGFIIRTTSTTARAYVTFTTQAASTAAYTFETDLTGLDFTTTNILKITGQAGGATGGSNDITAKMGKITYQP